MSEERLDHERTYEEALREAGFAITEENPEHKQGNLTVYSITAKKPETEHEYQAFGNNREAALKSLLIASKAR